MKLKITSDHFSVKIVTKIVDAIDEMFDENTFTDIDTADWYYESVKYVYQNKPTNWCSIYSNRI